MTDRLLSKLKTNLICLAGILFIICGLILILNPVSYSYSHKLTILEVRLIGFIDILFGGGAIYKGLHLDLRRKQKLLNVAFLVIVLFLCILNGGYSTLQQICFFPSLIVLVIAYYPYKNKLTRNIFYIFAFIVLFIQFISLLFQLFIVSPLFLSDFLSRSYGIWTFLMVSGFFLIAGYYNFLIFQNMKVRIEKMKDSVSQV